MTVAQFLRKWGDTDAAFQDDFFKMLAALEWTTRENQIQNVAIKLLTEIPDHYLKIEVKRENGDYINGYLKFGKSPETETIVTFSAAVGLSESDWFTLLQTLIKNDL